MDGFVLPKTGLDKAKQAQAKTGGLGEHWFALGEPVLGNPSGGANFATGRRRKALKTVRFPAPSLFASNKIGDRKKPFINGSGP